MIVEVAKNRKSELTRARKVSRIELLKITRRDPRICTLIKI